MKPVAKHRLVAKEGVLDRSLFVVARLILPLPTPDPVEPVLSINSAVTIRPRFQVFHAGLERPTLVETYPLRVLLLTVAGFVNRHQADVISYLVEENRVLKE